MTENSAKNQMTEIFEDVSHGARYYRCMKKTRGRKSLATVPLKWLSCEMEGKINIVSIEKIDYNIELQLQPGVGG